MATYPVKLLIDKNGTAFIPVVNSDSIITPDGDTLDDLLDEKQDAITDSNKLSSDLVSDVNSTNKFITSAERTTWNSKVDSSVTMSSHSGNYSSAINNNGNMVMIGSSYNSDGNVKNSVLVLGSSGFSIVSDNKNVIGTDQNKNLFLKNVITPTDDTDAVNKKYVDDIVGDIESLLGGI